jgi:hypothetical protein
VDRVSYRPLSNPCRPPCRTNCHGSLNLTDDDRKHASATIRNREPVARVLQSVLPSSGLVLEVASGTGEHAVYFARQFPSLTWQPSDASRASLRSIKAWLAAENLSNVPSPVELDATRDAWPVGRCEAIVCINMLHISPWAATAGLMRGASRVRPCARRTALPLRSLHAW